MSTLYVGGLPPTADAEFLRGLFRGFGELSRIRLVRRASGDAHRGFGYVTFDDADSALRAQESLDGTKTEGAQLRVAPAV
ncbi:MAG: RNA-binding protein [Myxococcota bacterium]